MALLVTGSIATDHLMTYGGTFAESLVVDQLDKLSVSFLVDDLEVRRGGVAANIAFGLGVLGLQPVLLGSVGEDFRDYRSWLRRHGVDCDSVHFSETKHTARFVCTTDRTMAQFASFYPGAMSEARDIELEPAAERRGGADYVLIGANDPEAMRRHTHECRQRGYRFLADPSQQLAFSDGELIRDLVDGAHILFSNEYEAHLTEQKTGWDTTELLGRVGTVVTTLGKDGVRVSRAGEEPIVVAAVADADAVEPTGVGDAFRAGFIAALTWDLTLKRAAQFGCLVAAYALEQVGTQEYELQREAVLTRMATAYGADASAELAPHLAGLA
ncbi:carbohydrate kinase family protein [Nocardioidaceae bacterium]|nr:carbohydrate kinase family protein [Nocardioidaceae bacterium]